MTNYNSDCKLNKQVKKKLINKYRDQRIKVNFTTMPSILKQLQEQILPKEAVKYKVPGEYWIHYHNMPSIFNLRPAKPYNKNPTTPKDGYGHQPAWKRRKYTPNNDNQMNSKPFNQRPQCKWGKRCNTLNDTGECKFRHTKSDIYAARKRPSGPPENRNKFKTRNFKNRTDKGNRKWKQNCKWGDKCRNLHNGKCNDYHPWINIKCHNCGKGHPTNICRAKTNTRKVYKPNAETNAPFSKMKPKDIKALALQITALQTKENNKNQISKDDINPNYADFSKAFKQMGQQTMNGMAKICNRFAQTLRKSA
eukprot:453738_1